MTAKDKLNRIKTVIDGGGVYRDYNDSTQAFNADIGEVEKALTKLEELERDVKRFIELLKKDNPTGRDTFDIELLVDKLEKVGAKE